MRKELLARGRRYPPSLSFTLSPRLTNDEKMEISASRSCVIVKRNLNTLALWDPRSRRQGTNGPWRDQGRARGRTHTRTHTHIYTPPHKHLSCRYFSQKCDKEGIGESIGGFPLSIGLPPLLLAEQERGSECLVRVIGAHLGQNNSITS